MSAKDELSGLCVEEMTLFHAKRAKKSETQKQIDDEPCSRRAIVSANDLSCNYTPAKYEKAATTIERAHSSAPDMSHSSWNCREISSWSWRFWHAVCFSFLMCVGRPSLAGHNFFGTFNDFRLFHRKEYTILMCWLRCREENENCYVCTFQLIESKRVCHSNSTWKLTKSSNSFKSSPAPLRTRYFLFCWLK